MATGIDSFSAPSPYQTVPVSDERTRLVVNSWLTEERLIAAAVPTDWSDRSVRTCGDALAALVSSLARSEYMADLTGPDRLTRAIAASNTSVLDANRARCGTETEKYCGVGLAVAIRSSRNVTIAMVPPIQVILVQGGAQTWLPARESWTTTAAGLEGQPLGWSDTVRPTIVSTVVRDSDEIVISTASVGNGLAHSGNGGSGSMSICQGIDSLCQRNVLDSYEVVAVSTRFAPGGVVGTVRTVTGGLIGSVDRRARSLMGSKRIND